MTFNCDLDLELAWFSYGFCTPSHLKLFNENLSKSSGDMEAHERVTDGQTKGIPIIILPLCCGDYIGNVF